MLIPRVGIGSERDGVWLWHEIHQTKNVKYAEVQLGILSPFRTEPFLEIDDSVQDSIDLYFRDGRYADMELHEFLDRMSPANKLGDTIHMDGLSQGQ